MNGSLGKMTRMAEYLNPMFVYDSIFDIDFEMLYKRGIRHLFFDVDNTIMTYADTNVSIECMSLFSSIQSMNFDSIILLSNNSNKERILKVAKQLQLPAVTFACKPFIFTMRRLTKERPILIKHSAMIGDQLLTDILMANVLKMASIYVDPMSLDGVSLSKQAQYGLQRWLMKSLSKNG